MGRKNQKLNSAVSSLYIIFGIMIFGVFFLYFFQKLSLKNKYICEYLGGLWERKERDIDYRCYTYEEFYAKP